MSTPDYFEPSTISIGGSQQKINVFKTAGYIYIYIYVHQYKYKSKYIYIYTIIYVYKYAGNPWINKLRGFAKSWVKLQTEVTVRTMIGGLGPRSVRCHVASWEILYEYLEMEVLMGQTSIDGGLNTLPCLITGGICMLG